MNIVVLNGSLYTFPRISFLQIAEKSIMACKFVICVKNFKSENKETPTEEHGSEKENVDFFECVAFEHAAKLLNRPLVKGAKIIVQGQMRNFAFEDVNKTPHFTNIVVVEQVQYSDSNHTDLSVVADLKETDIIFSKICNAGFLCIDEDDYYKIATFGR